MKKVLVVAALLGVMLIAGRLKQVGVSSAATLAGIGFVMLAAYALSELGKSLSLPQVTGYILAGVVLGPSVGGIISGEVVGEMRMFNTLALGLIATSAGLELDIRQIARLGKTLLLTTLIKVLVGVSLVAGTLLAIEFSIGSLGLEGRGELVTLALIAGVLSLGTSPSIALAVLSETRAKGRLSDLVLGAAVFKDLVVVVGLAVAIAVGRVLLEPGATLDASVLTGVGFELAGSIAAGGLVGLTFILYVRFIGAEMLLFVAAMILVVAELCRAFHLELLLVFIAAGFVVRNFSKFEHDLMRPLALVALPVFVVFFANAGASIDLLTTWKILPLALALCAARAVSYILASRIGGKWAGEPRVIQQHAWLAYLPQAGVTLGLVGLAGLQLPALATPITNTGMAVVALNLLIGPITLRRALGLAGEIPKQGPDPGSVDLAGVAVAPSPQYSSPIPVESSSAVLAAFPKVLRKAHATLAGGIHEALERFAVETRPHLPALPALGDEVPDLEVFREIVLRHRSAYQALYGQLNAVLGQVPQSVRVAAGEETPRHRAVIPFWSIKRGRKLPLRRLARIALGPAVARHVARSFEDGLRARGLREPRAEASDGPRDHDTATRPPPDLELGLTHLLEMMRDAGTRRLPAHRLRYSAVEPQVRRHLHSLIDGTEGELARLAQASWGSRLLDLRRTEVADSLRDVVARCVIEPAMATTAKVEPAIAVLVEWLGRRRADFGNDTAAAVSVVRLGVDFDKLTKSALGDLSREFRFAGTVRVTLTEIKARVAQIPSRIDCLFVGDEVSLRHGKVQTIQLQAHVDALIRHVMPPLELAARSVSAALSQVPRRIEDALRPEWMLLEAQVESAEAREIQALVHESLHRALRRVERVGEMTAAAVQVALDGLVAALDSACSAFTADVLSGPATRGGGEALQTQLARLLQAVRNASNWLGFDVFDTAPLMDAAAVRRSLQNPERTALPELVERWFDSAPVSDERIFCAHRRLMDRILDAEGSRAETGQASVHIVGPKGAGKSSLLNMCELELPSATHLRLHASDFDRETTLFEALGNLLDCPATQASLTRHLTLRCPAIFVDDLATWLCASPHRHLELERLLHLVTTTSAHAFWLVSIDVTMLRLLTEMADVEEAFTHVVRLPPLTLPEVKRLVESRLEIANQHVIWQPSRWARLIARGDTSRESERVYRGLWAASAGNPARVVTLCRGVFREQGEALTIKSSAIATAASTPYEFSEVQLAVLATLHRYGPQTLDRLQRELAVSLERLQRTTAFLIACGMVAPTDEGHAYSISQPAEWIVFETLVASQLAVTS